MMMMMTTTFETLIVIISFAFLFPISSPLTAGREREGEKGALHLGEHFFFSFLTSKCTLSRASLGA